MMTFGKARAIVISLLALVGTTSLRAEQQQPTPDFKEIYDLIRAHLSDINDADLNRAAVQGLLSSLGGKVSLTGGPETPSLAGDAILVSKASLFDGPIAYLRIARVAEGLDKAVREAWDSVAKTNQLAGLILDLRYADGTDYAAAVATAELFIKKEQPLLDWGQGMVRSKDNPELKTLPLAILVNQQTAAAPEALAAVLRSAGAALILGSRTAGQAMISQDYPLKDGQRLRIATAPIQLGDGSSLSSGGLKPDISVEVNAADERGYYADAFREISKPGSGLGQPSGPISAAGTNRVRRPRFNEAELVRERRDGTFSDGDSANNGADGEKPVVRDPVLARALDFLKGLSVIRQTHS
jgi:hypothetical protein